MSQNPALAFPFSPRSTKACIPPKHILPLERVLIAVMQPDEKAPSSPNWISYKLKTLVIAGAFFPFHFRHAYTHTFIIFLPVTF